MRGLTNAYHSKPTRSQVVCRRLAGLGVDVIEEVVNMDARNLRTVRQLAAETPISEAGWRFHLHRRHQNGLDNAVVWVGKRLLLDIERVGEWLESRREVSVVRGGAAMG